MITARVEALEAAVVTIRGATFDPRKDFEKSMEEGFRVIRERVAAGGPGWEPKP